MSYSVRGTVRLGIIGLGVMGRQHAQAIAQGNCDEYRLAAVADANPAAAQGVGQAHAVPFFTDSEAMLHSGLVDAVLVAAPHYLHAPLVIRAARAGVHVLCEKPMSVEYEAARLMVEECRRHNVALGACLQLRCRAIMKRIKHLVDSGTLGDIHQVTFIGSNWYRTQAYYDSGSWRGTWAGEGGGILTNQAPHHLDLLRWFFGRPARVSAFLSTRLHRIEVENTANVMYDYDNGMAAHLYFTTAESPRREQLVITGDKATLIAEGDTLRIGRLAEPLASHIHTCTESSADHIVPPTCDWEPITLEREAPDLRFELIRTFVRHLREGTPMVATGEDAAGQVELTNAIYLAGFGRRIVQLPLGPDQEREMRQLLDSLARQSRMAGIPNLRDLANVELQKLLCGEPAIAASR
jgi:predicted dehydrogenase